MVLVLHAMNLVNIMTMLMGEQHAECSDEAIIKPKPRNRNLEIFLIPQTVTHVMLNPT